MFFPMNSSIPPSEEEPNNKVQGTVYTVSFILLIVCLFAALVLMS